MKILLELFVSFFKTGLFTFGGGYAMLPVLESEVVQKKGWTTKDELLNYYSIGQCTPGIIAVNVATFCGYKLKKTLGAAVATFALVLPSFLIISFIATFLPFLTDTQNIAHIIAGIRIGIVALLINIVFNLGKRLYLESENKIWHSIIFSSVLLALLFFKISSVIVILAAFFCALFEFQIKKRRTKK